MPRRIGSASLALAALLSLPWAAKAAPHAPPQDEAEVSATLDADEVALDGVVTLQISVTTSSKGDTPELQLPPLREFDIVSRAQSEQVSFQFVGGQPSFRRTTVYTVALTPHRQGKATVEPASVTWKGKSYPTQPLSLRVLPAGQGPAARSRRQPPPNPIDPFAALGQSQQPGPDLGDADPFKGMHPGAKDLVLRGSVDTEHPFVGQQVTWSLFLLSRVNVSGIDKLQLPRLDGFWNEEIEAPQQLVGEQRIIDGVPYRSYLLRRRALFPLRPGKAFIEPADVEVLTGFGMLFSRSSLRRQSQKITLEVQPLPAGKPAGFDEGNVGVWSIAATAEPASAAVGQAITFRLQVTGRGNVRDLQLPKLPNTPGLRAYDATATDKSSVERGQVTGTRTVEQLLVPERSGDFVIPALAMETFDPIARAYKTIRSAPIPVSVHVGAASAGSGGTGAQAAQNLLAAGGLRPIRFKLSQLSAASAPPWSRPWFWPLFGLGPLAAVATLVALRTRRAITSDAEGRRVRGAARAAKKRLRGAQALLLEEKQGGHDAQAFYAEIARALTQYLADKQGVAAAGMTRDELARALAGRGHGKGTIEALLAALDECDRARFAPGASEVAAQEGLLARADRLLELLDGKHKEAA